MRYLLLFLIVTVLVAIAYSSPVPETAAVTANKPGVANKNPAVRLGPNGKPFLKRKKLKNGKPLRKLRAGRKGPGPKVQGAKGPLRRVKRKRQTF